MSLDTGADEVRFVQREDGAIVAQAGAVADLAPGTLYQLGVAWDGESFRVYLDRTLLLAESAGGGDEPFGRFGVGAARTAVAVESFFVESGPW